MGASVSQGRGRRGRRSVAEINVVPYIDVMLVLLIIFMVTAPMLQQGIEVDSPKTASKNLPGKDEPPVVVSVDKEGLAYLNVAEDPDAPIESENLKARIAAYVLMKKEQGKEVVLYVKGDGDAPYKSVVRAMADVKDAAGIERVGLITEPEK